MLVTMSNPGLHLAVIGNPGNPGRRKKRRSTKGKSMARRRMSKAQKKALAKGFRARGLPVPAKLRTNPGTKRGAAKSRRKLRRKQLRRRRSAAAAYRKRARGYHVVVRRKAGRRKANRRFSRAYGIRTGRKGTISFRRRKGGRSRLVATNPRRRRSRRRTRTNPPLTAKSWARGITALPTNLMGIFRGKDMLPNVGMAGLGVVTGIVGGGMARGFVMGAVGSVAPGIASNRLVQGLIGGLVTYTGGYAAGRLLIKNDRRRVAFVTGSAVAALAQALFPGAITGMLTSIPFVGPQLARLPGMNGLGAYVAAPGYQGVGRYAEPLAGYVEAPGYQAVGYDPAVAGADDALAGELGAYVEAPGYQGVGMWGSSHLDQ